MADTSQTRSLNTTAQKLKSLHQPGNPLVFVNVYDATTAEAVASHPNCKALATSSSAIARAQDKEEAQQDLQSNLHAVSNIVKVTDRHSIPCTADLEDGYGDNLQDAIKGAINIGVVGANIEDRDKQERLYPVDVAVERIATAVRVAREAGVPDFVVNARCDVLINGGTLDEVISRGRRYLDAGATCVFVWGGARGVSRAEIIKLTEAFEGRLNVRLMLPMGQLLTVNELSEIGVCRISIGSGVVSSIVEACKREAEVLLQ